MKFSPHRKYKYINSFISHDSRDNREANRYHTYLTDHGFSAYEYGTKLPPGSMLSDVKKNIIDSHFFVLLITDNSTAASSATWVRRELGLAIKTNQDTNGYKPIIIPICGRHCWWRDPRDPPPDLEPLDFDTKQPLEKFTLHDIRVWDKYSRPRIDRDELLIEFMKPELLVSRLNFFDSETFDKTEVFKLYNDIFPDNEMDSPEDIMAWVLRDDIGETRKVKITDDIEFEYCLDSRLFILTLCEKAVGLSFFTYDHNSKLLFGNYIAVQKDWRSGDIATAFKDEIMMQLEILFPEYVGVVFEVEKFDEQRIKDIIEDLRESNRKILTTEELDQIRRFRRVGWYQLHGCRFFIDTDHHEALSCRSPCLNPKLPRHVWAAQEEEYWLMWCPRRGSAYDVSRSNELWKEAVQLIYIEILAKSLVEKHSQVGQEYWQYAQRIVKETLESTSRNHITMGSLFDRHSELWASWVKLKIDIAM